MWIDEFRREHGMDVDEFARRVRMLGARKYKKDRGRSFPVGCSSDLVYRLEMAAKPRTHPNIADLIAEACGATAEQRDSIVDPMHRGTWSGDGVPKILDYVPVAFRAKANETEKKYVKGREIVRIDRGGNVTGRFVSLVQAAEENHVSIDVVEMRVKRYISGEFDFRGFSFRYADEWDRYSQERRRADMEWALLHGKKPRNRRTKKGDGNNGGKELRDVPEQSGRRVQQL